jgi:hypothetical protein
LRNNKQFYGSLWKVKKGEAPKASPQTQHFFFLLWARGSKKRSQGQKFIGFRKFQNLQQTVTKRSLNFVEDGRSLYGRYND